MDKNKLTMDILNKLSLKVMRGVYPGMESATNVVQSPNSETSKNNKKILLVFTGSNLCFEESLKESEKLRGYGYNIEVAMSESAEQVLGVDKIKSALRPNKLYTAKDKMDYLDIVKSSDAVVVPVATQNTAIKLSMGIQDSFISMLLWQSLWQGKTLFMNMDDMITHRGMEAKSKQLRQMMGEYVDKLKRLGVKPVSTLKLSSEVHKLFSAEKTTGGNFDSQNERPVITEKDILSKANMGETIILPLRAIITPLARDAAKSLGIKIVKQKV